MRIATVSVVSLVVFVALPAAADPPRPPTDDVAVKAALDRQGPNVDLSRAGELSTPTSAVPTIVSGASGPQGPQGDALRVASTGARASQAAGASRGVALATSGVERPAAGLRTMQRMDASRVLASLEPAMRACAQRNPATSPATTLTVRLSVTSSGEVEQVHVIDRAAARDEAVACVVDVMSTAKFRAPAGAGASVNVPVLLPAKGATVSALPVTPVVPPSVTSPSPAVITLAP